jgi:hypothetical protein
MADKRIGDLTELEQIPGDNDEVEVLSGGTNKRNKLLHWLKTLFEVVSNKKTTLTDSDTDYPTTKAVNTGVSTHAAVETSVHGIGTWPLNSTANKTYYVDSGKYAKLVTGTVGDNNYIRWIRKTIGTAGNSYSVEMLDPGAVSQPLSVSTSGTKITVSLATDGAGAITSTARQVCAAIRGNSTAHSWVWVTLGHSNSSGDGVVVAVAETNLSGGLAAAGSDSNNGESSGAAFATWAKVLTVLPTFITHNYRVVILGDMNVALNVASRYVGGYLDIKGDPEDPDDHVVGNNLNYQSVVGSCFYRYLTTMTSCETNASIISSKWVDSAWRFAFDNCRFFGERDTVASRVGTRTSNSIHGVYSCNYGTENRDGLDAFNSRVFSYLNGGNLRQYGIFAREGATVGKYNATQPTGVTANEFANTGAVIR